MGARAGILLALSVLLAASGCRTAQQRAEARAAALLERSIEFHDPQGQWGREEIEIQWTGSGPDGEQRLALRMRFSPDGEFAMHGDYRGVQIDYRAIGATWSASVDGETELSDAVRASAVLDREEGLFWRNYFGFLAGLPMCLRGPGLHVSPEVIETTLDGRAVQAIVVAFDPELGSDRWTLYIEPESAQLIGCRFDRADPERDGETLLFEDLAPVAGMRLPARRRWFMNADGEFLGTDEIAAADQG